MCLYQFILVTNSGESLGVSGEVTVFTPTIDNAGLFYFCHSGEYILACISLMTNKIEYFSNIIVHLNTYCLVWVFCSFFCWVVCLFWWYVGVFGIFWIWVLCQSNELKYLLLCGFPLTLFLFLFFDDKKVQILM